MRGVSPPACFTRCGLKRDKVAGAVRKRSALNTGLRAAKTAKKDEFYTQYIAIQKEVEAYLEFNPDTFRGKVVY